VERFQKIFYLDLDFKTPAKHKHALESSMHDMTTWELERDPGKDTWSR
jgi:hypothetical protein